MKQIAVVVLDVVEVFVLDFLKCYSLVVVEDQALVDEVVIAIVVVEVVVVFVLDILRWNSFVVVEDQTLVDEVDIAIVVVEAVVVFVLVVHICYIFISCRRLDFSR